MKAGEFITLLRRELPALLAEDSGFRAEIVGVLSEALGTKAEFVTILEEVRALRASSDRQFEEISRRFEAMENRSNQRFEAMEERFNQRFDAADRRSEAMEERFNQRFEAIDRRFEAMENRSNQRFEAIDRRFEAAERRFEAIERTLDEHTRQLRELTLGLRELRVGMGSLGGRMGRGLEDVIRQIIEDFSGIEKMTAERLILEDAAGEVFGVAGARIEFDAYVQDGRRFLVEVKNYLEEGDVLTFHRKVAFAEKQLGAPVEKMLFAPAAERAALETAKRLDISVRTFSILD